MAKDDIGKDERRIADEVRKALNPNTEIRVLRPRYNNVTKSWCWRSDMATLERLIREMKLKDIHTGATLQPDDVQARLRDYGDPVFTHERVHKVLYDGAATMDLSNPREAFVFYSTTDHTSE